MPSILPVSDLRNYNEVLKNCQIGEPVFLTKNGRGKFVILDIEDYERERAEKKLLMKLREAEGAVKDDNGWLTLDELKKVIIYNALRDSDEEVEFLYNVSVGFFFPQSGIFARFQSVECRFVIGVFVQVELVILGCILVVSGHALHVGQVDKGNVFGVVVSHGIFVGTYGS